MSAATSPNAPNTVIPKRAEPNVERRARAASGWPMLAVDLALFVASLAGIVAGITRLDAEVSANLGGALLFLGIVALCAAIILACGFFSLQPGQARVLVLFGTYKGTVRDSGFFWANPFYSRSLGSQDEGVAAESIKDVKDLKAVASAKGLSTKVSVRARTLNGERLKVNDRMGNPIEIAAAVVWRVEDTAKALFDVDDYPGYVAMQTETTLRHVASAYAYDHMEEDDEANHTVTLRSNVEEVSETLKRELGERLAVAGVAVDEARLTHLAYAPEIAQAMLRRQQADAVIAARGKIVRGAVDMVEMALSELSDKHVVTMDEDRKAAMVSNLLVVLCGDSDAQPVVNTGTIYQ